MRNCLVLGCGRSGTSMISGILAKAGYFMGENLYPARDSNPKGFFESPEVNRINEDLIANAIPVRPRWALGLFFRDRPARHQLWLSRVPVGTPMPHVRATAARIQQLVNNEPFCFKDPRFSYTLPAWRPFLPNTVFVCVFRHPAVTAASILKECKNATYLHNLSMNWERALEIWVLMYRHILEIHRYEGEWLFLHYDQAFSDEGLSRIERFVQAQVDRDFPDPSLRRSVSSQPLPQATWQVYEQLCELAEYADGVSRKLPPVTSHGLGLSTRRIDSRVGVQANRPI